eukprot:Em0114g12a
MKNESDKDYILSELNLVIEDPAVRVQLSPKLPLLVAKGSEENIAVTISGVFQVNRNYLVFDFGSNTKYCCDIEVTVVTKTIELILPNRIFEPEPKKKKYDYQSKLSNAVEGEKLRLSGDGVDIPGDPCIVPGNIRHRPKGCLPSLAEPLTMENYSDHFHKLLWLDEMRREGNIREYDISSAVLIVDGAFLCLDVPGLTKRKEEVIVGDKLIFSIPEVPSEGTPDKGEAEQPSFARQAKNYIGYVHQISGERLKLKFNRNFHESKELWGKKYDVMFTVKRGPLRRMHKALDNAQQVGETILFPTVRPTPPTPLTPLPSRGSLQFINTRLNLQQRRAVEAIVSVSFRTIPYILFGPPGTGKTVTVVESILQVYKHDTTSSILACTPSNSAADLLAERLHTSGHIKKGSIIRLNAFMRSQEVPPSIHSFTTVADKKAKSKTKGSRIVICTCSTAAILHAFKMTFSYVFVDEAGQALEPECLIPVSLLAKGHGQLVLAGDPLQLGPVILSPLASNNGLSISMLERLMGRDMYKRDTTVFAATGNYDSMVVTKLVENYRSHGMLLRLYSDQFYDGELVERADHRITHSLCNWEYLPTKGVPLLFHGIQGTEYGSPSWFNPFEADKARSCVLHNVLFYTMNLVQQHSVLQKDIGIISPYNKQVEKIRILLGKEGLSDVRVGSVEEFQGRENLVIIISTVRSSNDLFVDDMRKQVGFVSNPKRYNVAISRAQALLIVVGNPHLLAQALNNTQSGTLPGQVCGPAPPLTVQASCWTSLIQFAKDHGCYTGCPLLTV